jgi:tetratricopeptide (TPR) repeat protein
VVTEREGDPWAKKNARAIELLKAGELSAAVALFSECVSGDPTEPVFRANLAEALARLAQEEYEVFETRSLAIEHLTQAVELAPERSELVKLLERWLAEEEVEGDFWTDRSLHFRLSYDGDREELLGRGYDLVLKTLEDAYSEYAALFGIRPAEGDEPLIEVVLLQRAEFSGLTGLGHWAGGAYDGRIRVPITNLAAEQQRLVSVLRHELVHAFVRSAGGRSVVGWLNEGLAEWLEEPAGAARDAAVERARRGAAGAPLRSLDELGGSLAALGSVEEIRAAYSQSLALVGWIEHWYGERVLFAMVAGCRSGASVAESFEDQTRVSLSQVLKDLEFDLKR